MLGLNLLVILAELSLTIAVFCFLNWLFAKSIQPLSQISWLHLGTSRLQSLRRRARAILLASCGLACLLILLANIILVYQGKNLAEYTLALMRQFPQEFWIALGTGLFKSLAILILASVAIRPLHGLLDSACTYLQEADKIKANDAPIEIWFGFLKKHLTNGIWLFVLWACSHFLRFPSIVPQYLGIFLLSYAIIILGLLTIKATGVLVNTLDAISHKRSRPNNLLRFYPQLRHLIPLLRRCLEFAIYTCMATLVIGFVEPISFLANYGPVVIKIIAIVFLSRVCIESANLIAEELLLKSQDLTEEKTKKRRTILPILQSILKYGIFFGTGILILETIGIDPTPILAAAGILGLAIGLGAQSLINDIVCGFFILFENYYLVGDYIELEDTEGLVEAIELTTTRLRHNNGQVCIIRNGQIGNIINYSKQYVYAVVEIGIAYESNLDRVYNIIQEIGKLLQANEPDVLEPTVVDGLEEFGEFELVVRTLSKVKPGKNRRIQRVLRKMIKEAFDREGIEIPHASQVEIVNDGQNGDRLLFKNSN